MAIQESMLQEYALNKVDTIIGRAIASGDPLVATNYGNQLSNEMSLRGIALAKLFYHMRSNWPLFEAHGVSEDFVDFVDAHMFVKGSTAQKYANMYEAIFVRAELSDELKEQLTQKPVKTLLLLTAAVSEGVIKEDDLSDAILKSHYGVHEMVRSARGSATSSGTAVYARLVQRESLSYPIGTLVVFGPNGESEGLGVLNLEPRTEAGRKYLERIKNTMGLEDIR